MILRTHCKMGLTEGDTGWSLLHTTSLFLHLHFFGKEKSEMGPTVQSRRELAHWATD